MQGYVTERPKFSKDCLRTVTSRRTLLKLILANHCQGAPGCLHTRLLAKSWVLLVTNTITSLRRQALSITTTIDYVNSACRLQYLDLGGLLLPPCLLQMLPPHLLLPLVFLRLQGICSVPALLSCCCSFRAFFLKLSVYTAKKQASTFSYTGLTSLDAAVRLSGHYILVWRRCSRAVERC